MKRVWVFSTLLAVMAAGLAAGDVVITVSNPTSDNWSQAPVVLKWQEGMPGRGAKLPLLLKSEGADTPCQVDDLNGDGTPDELVFLADLKAGQAQSYRLTSATLDNVPQRAHTGMYLKTDTMKGMEGPGWESDLIAFRLYWDERNPVDLFGKTQSILSLDAFASAKLNYHIQSKYGQDILKVGKALGVGGFAVMVDGKVEKASYAKRDYRVAADGPLRAAIDLKYNDWETSKRRLQLTARMNIFAGQRWGEAQLKLAALDGQPLPDFVTGVVKHPDTELIQDKEAGIVGRWGRQALGDKEVPKSADLGLGVVADPQRIVELGQDDVNSYIRMSPGDGTVTYRYHASWEKEPGAAKSAKEYEEKLRALARLKPAVKIEINGK
jgi:hypothetical protein